MTVQLGLFQTWSEPQIDGFLITRLIFRKVRIIYWELACHSSYRMFSLHYENIPMQYTEFFFVVKMKIFTRKKRHFSYVRSKHRLWVHVRTASLGRIPTIYYVLGQKIRKIGIYPRIPQFFYIKVGFNGVYFSWTCFPDGISTGLWY